MSLDALVTNYLAELANSIKTNQHQTFKLAFKTIAKVIKNNKTKKQGLSLRSLINMPYDETSKSFLLHLAVFEQHYEAALTLLKHGADVDIQRKDAASPLWLAACLNDKNFVELLLTYQANPNAVNLFGVGPLQLACEHNHLDVVDLLLKAGANPDQKAANGLTVRQQFEKHSNLQLVQLLNS